MIFHKYLEIVLHTYRLKMSFVFPNLVDANAFKTSIGFDDLPDVATVAVMAFVYLYRSIYGDRYANAS